MAQVWSGHRYFLPGQKNSGGAKITKHLFVRWPWLDFAAFLGKRERKNGQHPDMGRCTVRWCSKCLCEKDDQRTYSYDPLKNIYGVSPPLGAFSSGCLSYRDLGWATVWNWGFRSLWEILTPIGRGFRAHKNYGQLRIAGLHVLVWGHRTQPHLLTPPEEKNRVQCLFWHKKPRKWKSPNFGGFLCFWGPRGRSRPKDTPVFASPWVHGSRVSFMGVVLGTGAF